MASAGINGVHDLGGVLTSIGAIDLIDKPLSYWERSVHALLIVLASRKPSPVISTDELRRTVEGLEKTAYNTWSYYDRWVVAMTLLLLEKGFITQVDLDREINGDSGDFTEETPVLYKAGDSVKVRAEDTRLRWRRPHLRCPGYIYGLKGKVKKYLGKFDDPFLLAFSGKGPQQPLYVVSFQLNSIWSHGTTPQTLADGAVDCIELDIYQEWLEFDVGTSDGDSVPDNNSEKSGAMKSWYERETPSKLPESMNVQLDLNGLVIDTPAHVNDDANSANPDDEAHHNHQHSHSHEHQPRDITECNAVTNEGETTPGKIIGDALFRLLYGNGFVKRDEIRNTVMQLDNAGVKLAAAELVAYAWIDPEFKARLMAYGMCRCFVAASCYTWIFILTLYSLIACVAPTAAAEVGIETSNANAPTILRVVENTPDTHNVIVCTLCSCYPVGLLGYAPLW